MANITDKVEQIREAIYGKDVRESLASGIEAINEEVTGTTTRQNTLETNMNNLADDLNESEAIRVSTENERNLAESERATEFQEIVQIYETASHDNVNIELVNARGGQVDLKTRLDNMEDYLNYMPINGGEFDGSDDLNVTIDGGTY